MVVCFIYRMVKIISSGAGSNRMVQGPPIQVVGAASITEFYDRNYSFIKVVSQ